MTRYRSKQGAGAPGGSDRGGTDLVGQAFDWTPARVFLMMGRKILRILKRMPGMITSKLTSKARTTVPQPVRAALGLQPGDELVYEIIDQKVILTKAKRRMCVDDPFATFSEWHSEADEKGFA